VLVYVHRVFIVVSSVGVWCVVYTVMIEIRVKIVKSERRIVVFPGFFMFVVRPRLYAIELWFFLKCFTLKLPILLI